MISTETLHLRNEVLSQIEPLGPGCWDYVTLL